MLDSTLFLVRVWRRLAGGEPGFRASVREAGGDEARLFTRADELAQYFDRASERAAAAAPSTGDDHAPHR